MKKMVKGGDTFIVKAKKHVVAEDKRATMNWGHVSSWFQIHLQVPAAKTEQKKGF